MKSLSGPITLIKKSFEIFFKKENFIYFLKIQSPLLVFAFISFIWVLLGTYGAPKLSENLSTNPIFVFSGAALNLLNTLVYLFVTAASIEAIHRVLGNSSFSLREVFLTAKGRYWKYLLMSMLKSLIVIAGLVLLIIPGIVFSVWFAFSGVEVVLNKAGVKESLLKSKALVTGRFWPVFGRLFVFGIYVGVISISLASLPFGIGNLVSAVFGIFFLLPVYLLFKELEGQGQG